MNIPPLLSVGKCTAWRNNGEEDKICSHSPTGTVGNGTKRFFFGVLGRSKIFRKKGNMCNEINRCTTVCDGLACLQSITLLGDLVITPFGYFIDNFDWNSEY